MIENGEFPENIADSTDSLPTDAQKQKSENTKTDLPIVNVKENHIDDAAPIQTINIQPQESNRPTLRKITEDASETGVSGTIKKSYEEKKQSGNRTSGGLLKEVDGAMQKPSGTIVVK